jgi:hypothetical protein
VFGFDRQRIRPERVEAILVVVSYGGLITRSIWRGLVSLALPLAIAPSVGSAPSPPEVDFSDVSPIKIVGDGGDSSVDVEVCNTASTPVTVELRLAGFDSGKSASAILLKDGASLEIGQVNNPLVAGDCASAILMYQKGSGPAAASGSIVLLARGSGLARRSVSVAVEPRKATKPITELKLSGSFATPFGVRGEVQTDSRSILVRYEGAIAPVVPAGTLIGEVAAGADLADVWTTSASTQESSGVLRIPIELRGVSGSGTFSGDLDSHYIGSADKPTAITFTIRDHWSLAAAVFVLGLLLSVAARWVAGALLPRKRLAFFRGAVGEHYRQAYDRFVSLSPVRAAGFEPPGPAKVDEFVAKNRAATQNYARTLLVFDMASDAVKAIRDQIAAANADADLMAEAGTKGLAAHLESLDTRIEAFKAFVDHKFDQHSPEKLVAYAETALGNRNKRTEVPIGGVSDLILLADSAVTSMVLWESDAQRIRRFVVWWSRLSKKLGNDPDDAYVLEDVRRELKEAMQALVELAKPNDPGRGSVQRNLARAEVSLSRLGATHDVRVPPDWEQSGNATSVPLYEILDSRRLDGADEDADSRGGPISVIGNLLEPDEPGPKLLIVLLEAFTLIVTAGVTASVAARLLYVNKPFGTVSDYLAMFGAGIGSELLAAGALAAVANWRAPTAIAKAVHGVPT